MIKRLIWLTPKSNHGGMNEFDVLGEYMGEKGYEIHKEIEEGKEYEAIFSFSDSQTKIARDLRDRTKAPWLSFFGGCYSGKASSVKLEYLRDADLVFTPTFKASSQLLDFGINSCICYLGVDVKFIDSVPALEEKNQMIYVGDLTPSNHVDDLLVGMVTISNPPKIVLFGDGVCRKYLEAFATRLGLDVEFRNGDRLERIKAIKESKFFVDLSSFSGFPFASLEAMACSKAVATSAEAPNYEVMLGRSAYSSDMGELSITLNTLNKNRKAKEAWGEIGRKLVLESYTMDAACDRLIQILEAVKK